MENISVQTYLLIGARQFQGGMINGQLLPPSARVIAALSMDETTGNAKGLNATTFKCTGLEVFSRVARMDLPCMANLTLLQVAAGNGTLTQIVRDVQMVEPVKLPVIEQPVATQPVQHKKAS